MGMCLFKVSVDGAKVRGMGLGLGCCLVEALLQDDALQTACLAVPAFSHPLLDGRSQGLLGWVRLYHELLSEERA